MHVDKKNVGPSVVIALGDHTGGEIWQASAKIDGQEIFGGPIFAHNEAHYFDGNVPHCTLPFEGERYSIIAYLLSLRTGNTEKAPGTRCCQYGKQDARRFFSSLDRESSP